MKPGLWAGFALSSALHGALAFVLPGSEPEDPVPREPLLVDFTVDPPPESPSNSPDPTASSEPSEGRAASLAPPSAPPVPLPAVPPPRAVAPAPAEAREATEDAKDEPPAGRAEDAGVAERRGDDAGVQVSAARGTENDKGIVGTTTTTGAAVAGASGGRGGGARGGSGAAAASAEYNRLHFEYLRREIHRRLVYPEVAREMGWEGRVLLSFLVAQDGTVREITVTESSGIALLDKSAVATVYRAAPLPRPPCDVRVLMPIAYVLQ